MSLCQLKNVKKIYPMGDLEVAALRGVDLTIEAGEFTVIAGPSGSGKSTVLNLIGCLDRPTTGEVFLEDRPVAKMSDGELGAVRAARIGFIFQSFNLIPVLTAFENVELALRLSGKDGGRKELVEKALSDVALGDYMHRRPSQLSGGQQQRVAIARALVKAPALVIADEPTANLDSANGKAILDLMREMNERSHITFLFSTHDPMVMSRAKRVVRLVDGVIAGDERATQPAVAGSAG
jgi:putative ABC transport system ATP-binding protein